MRKEYRQIDIDYFNEEPELARTCTSMSKNGWDIQYIFNPRKYVGGHDKDTQFVRVLFVRTI